MTTTTQRDADDRDRRIRLRLYDLFYAIGHNEALRGLAWSPPRGPNRTAAEAYADGYMAGRQQITQRE
jgi:hypothetical protein